MFTQAHGIKTHYQRLGTGPTLVLLHGWGCDWQIWYPLIQALSEDFQLVLPDLPAFGQSAAPATAWTSRDYGQWLSAFLTQVVGDTPFVLIGHSFGGKISALYTADQRQPQPQKLIIVDSAGTPDELPPSKKIQQQVLRLIPDSFKQAIPKTLKRRLLQASGSAEDHFNSTDTQRMILRRTIRENLTADLPKIKVPTLLIWGANDPDTPLHHGQQFHHGIPGSELEVLTTGHFPFIDDPQTFMRLVKDFAHD